MLLFPSGSRDKATVEPNINESDILHQLLANGANAALRLFYYPPCMVSS